MTSIGLRAGSVLLAVLLASGCVTGRRAIPLPVPETGEGAAAKGEIYLAPIEDARTFEDKPKDPSTPSARKAVGSLTPDEKQILIGRQRNGYGRAMGDVVLDGGQTVSERMRELVKAALAKRGYHVTDDAQAKNAATVKIDQFWGWFTPHFANFEFEANVAATLTVKRGSESREVHAKGYGRNSGQVAKNANWQLAFERAFKDFLQSLDHELAAAGL